MSWVKKKYRKKKVCSEVCSEHVNDWKYFSLGDLEQNEGFPNGKSWSFLVPYRLIVVTWHVKMKEIGELVANLLFLG